MADEAGLFERMKLVELEPLDTVFFGDARGMDLNIGGRSLRFPLPWTVSGALLSHYLLITGRAEDVNKGCRDLGDCESEEKGENTVFAFYGPFLSYGGSYWFSSPADIALRADSSGRGVVQIEVRKVRSDGYAGYLPEIYLPFDAEPYAGRLVDHEFLESYADGKLKQPKELDEEILSEERRVGIHIDDSRRTVKAGYTFSSIHIRPKPGLKYAVLVAEKERRDFSFSGIIRFGGEGRVARASEGSWIPSWLRRRGLKAGDIVKAVLISPAIYRKGSLNCRIPDVRNLPGRPELLGAGKLVIGGRAVMVSGWDLRTVKARRMYAAVPPGTVYYMRLNQDADRAELTLSFWRLSLFWERGFGSPLIAVGGPI